MQAEADDRILWNAKQSRVCLGLGGWRHTDTAQISILSVWAVTVLGP